MKKQVLCGISILLILLLLTFFGESMIPLYVLFAVILIIGASLLIGVATVKYLDVEVSAEDLTEKNHTLSGVVTVINRGRFPFPVLKGEIEVLNLLTGEVVVQKLTFAVPPKGASSAEVRFTSAHCGKISLSVKRLQVCDYFGLFRFSVLRNADAAALVLPEVFPMDVTLMKTGVTEPECETFSPYKAGNDPSETFGIRDYEPGDSLRSIHWKLTGKFDRMVIRESSLPVNESVLILLERVCPVGRATSSAAVRNALGEIAISLSQALVDRDIAHTVGWLRAENGTFVGYRIDSEESFQLLMGEILSVYEIEGKEDTVEGYLKTNEHNDYSNIVYISSHPSEHVSFLPMMAKKTMLLCSDGEVYGEGDFYVATPQDYATSLYQIMI